MTKKRSTSGASSRAARLLVALAMVALAACGGDDDAQDTEAEATGGEGGGGAGAVETCDDVDLSQPPDSPVDIQFGGSRGSELNATVFLMDGVAPEDVRQHAGTWYTFENQPFPLGTDRITALRAGQVQGFIGAIPQPWVAMAEGIDVQAVASALIQVRGSYADPAFLVAEDSSVEEGDYSTFVDQTIGSPGPQTGAEMAFLGAIELGGGDPSDADLVTISLGTVGQALRGGQVDLTVGFEPITTAEVTAGGVRTVGTNGDVFADYLDVDYVSPLNFYFATDFIEENPGALCAWLEDYRASLTWARDNVEEVRAGLVEGEYVAGTVEELQARPSIADTFPEDGAVDVTNEKLLAEMAVDLGVIAEDQVPDWDSYAASIALVK